MKNFFKVVIISVGIFALLGIAVKVFASTGDRPEEMTYSYFKEAESAQSVKITGRPNVRSEPMVFDDYRNPSPSTTSYGRMGKNSEMKVSQVFSERRDEWIHEPLDYSNGYFIGILVSDIEKLDNWQEIFPKDITKDPDGIVWINCDYISVD